MMTIFTMTFAAVMFSGMVLCMGEITTKADVDIPKIVRQVIVDIGYDRAKFGFDGHTCAVLTSIDEQSGDIAMGVDKALEYKEGKLHDVKFTGGCNGNLKGIGKLVEGEDAKTVANKILGTTCGFKQTSCPDQLAKAILSVLEN